MLPVLLHRFIPSPPDRSSTIVCTGRIGNHSDLSGVPLGWGAGWAVTRKKGASAAIKAAEPADTHWAVDAVG